MYLYNTLSSFDSFFAYFQHSLISTTNPIIPYFFRFVLFSHATWSPLLRRACYHCYAGNTSNTRIYIIRAIVTTTRPAHQKCNLLSAFPTHYQRTSPAIALHLRFNLRFYNYSRATSSILCLTYS